MAHAAPKKSTQWTNKLGALVDEEKINVSWQNSAATIPSVTPALGNLGDDSVATTLRLEGPYFTPANPELFRTAVCLVAGTGLSGAIAIAAAFQAQRSLPRTEWKASPEDIPATTGAACTMVASNGPFYWKRCIVIWTVRESDFVDVPYITGRFDPASAYMVYADNQKDIECEGLEFRVHKTGGGRPRLDTRKTLAEICKGEAQDTWCYISGPGGFIAGAEQACSDVKGLTYFAARWD